MNDPSLLERAIECARLSSIALDLKTPLGHGTDIAGLIEAVRDLLLRRQASQHPI
jgi:hypothetical protein